MKILCGIDWASDHHDVALVDADGTLVARVRILTTLPACHCLRTHRAGKGKRRSMGERDFIALVDGAHQFLKTPIVLVWDRLNTHLSHAVREPIAEREWLTVFLLPAYSPDLNPVEWVWAHVKRSLANLAVVALDRLEALVRMALWASRAIRAGGW
ncbi:transposase [Streptomyces sp. NPDC005897]|uniref:transposase n=1 Tax=Streptomyces sp. NPDC005897 TaxID=3157081 RepID=UPI00340230BC